MSVRANGNGSPNRHDVRRRHDVLSLVGGGPLRVGPQWCGSLASRPLPAPWE